MVRRKKRKTALSKLPGKVGTLAGSGMVVGAGAIGTAAVGGDASGMATMGSMLRPVASISMMETHVGMLNETTKHFKTKKGYHRMPSGRLMKGKKHPKKRY